MGHYLSEMGERDHTVWCKPMYMWSKEEKEKFRKDFMKIANKAYKEKKWDKD